jgi:hypothetical protein
MAEQLFLFMQIELPWELGPADGRYLLRGRAGGEPERVVVLGTLAAARRRRSFGSRRGAGGLKTLPEPEPVPTARATVIDPVPVATEGQARRWLTELDAERETAAAATTVNRVLFAHRVATADPYVHELSPAHALVVRAGWGEGEEVAYGRWTHARELTWKEPRARRRSAALRPQERLAVLLGARGEALVCEELALRARLDLDQGRPAHAALELQQAYAAALVELPGEGREALAERIAELGQLRGGVTEAARAALGDPPTTTDGSPPQPAQRTGAEQSDGQALSHALDRLEAALRARTATGFSEQ